MEILSIDPSRFSDPTHIEARLSAVPLPDRGRLRTALLYLYDDDGPVNLPRDRLKAALPSGLRDGLSFSTVVRHRQHREPTKLCIAALASHGGQSAAEAVP